MVEKVVTRTIEVERVVTREVPVEIVVTREVVREVPVDRIVVKEVPAPDAPRVVAGPPQTGGRVRWGSPRSPAGAFDPALATGAPIFFNHWVYENLVDVDADFNELPRLAESWEPEDSGANWVFQLRPDVQFHHGREFIADDVLHTFNRILDPELGSPGKDVYARIEEVEKLDDHRVRFRLAAPNADFPVQLAAFQGRIVPHDLTDEQVNSEPRGTGPFAIDTYVNSDRILFGKFDDYWVPGKPYVDEVEFVSIPEAATLANALRAGEVELIMRISAQLTRTLQGESGIDLAFTPAMIKHQMYMQIGTPPFDDDRVRRAFKLIGDRAAMTEIAWPDFPARPDDDNPVIPPSPFRIDTRIWRQDLATAKSLIEEAGYAEGLAVTLWAISDETGMLDFCLAFADWAKQAGVDVNVEPIKGDIYYATKWLQVPFGTVSWSPRTTVDEQLRVAYTTGAKWNETQFSDPEFDAMLDEALAETDRARRAASYAEIQRRLITDGGQIIPYHYPIAAAHTTSLQGFRVHPLTELDPREIWLSDS